MTMYKIPMQDKKNKESLLESYVYLMYRTILADIKFQQINSGQTFKVFFFFAVFFLVNLVS